MNNMKIALINAIKSIDFDLNRCISFGLCYISSYLKKYGGYNKIKIFEHNYEKEITKFKPDIIGISSVSQNFEIAKRIAHFAKRNDIIVIIGGPHITVLPYLLTKDMDIAVIGEGEQTFLEVIQIIEKYGLNKNKLENIKGIAYHKDGLLEKTDKRELIKDLDTIPFPDRELVTTKNAGNMITSRGCPYKCVFCSSSRLWDYVRFHSAEYVVNEIIYLKNRYNVKHITMWDDLFIVNKKRFHKIVDLIKKERINEEISFSINARANLISDDLVKKFVEMSIKGVSLGLESMSPEILHWAKGESITVNDNINAVNILKKYGIHCWASFIIGFPMDTHETINATLNYIKKSPLDSFDVYLLAPFPGTPIWEECIKRKIVSNDIIWDTIGHVGVDNYDKKTRIILNDNLSPKEIYHYLNKAKLERDKRRHKRIIMEGLKHPQKIVPYLLAIITRKLDTFKNRYLNGTQFPKPLKDLLKKTRIK